MWSYHYFSFAITAAYSSLDPRVVRMCCISQLTQAKMKVTAKPLITYCNSISKRPNNKKVLAPAVCYSYPCNSARQGSGESAQVWGLCHCQHSTKQKAPVIFWTWRPGEERG